VISSLSWVFSLTLLVLVGCSNLVGNLRRDLDDRSPYYEPTVGGQFPERSQLNDYEFESPTNDNSDYRSVGHSERGVNGYEVSPLGQGSAQGRSPASQRAGLSQGPNATPSYSTQPNQMPQTKRLYQSPEGKPMVRARRSDFIDNQNRSEGSLWASSGQTNYFFVKNQVKSIGDLVTVVINDGLLKDIAVEMRNSLDQMELNKELMEIRTKKLAEMKSNKLGRNPASTTNDQDSASTAGTPNSNLAESDEEEEIDLDEIPAGREEINLIEKLDLKTGEAMMAEIIERYPNGNYKIRGTKRVPYLASTRMVTLVAIARGNDLKDKESLNSDQLYEYRVKAFR